MVAKRACGVLLLSVLLLGGCLSHRLTADQVVLGAQRALARAEFCHWALAVEFRTDLLQDSLSVELDEGEPDWMELLVRSATTPQLRGLAFASDGQQSIAYSPRTGEARLGPADVVRMPSAIAEAVLGWRDWLEQADPDEARLLARKRDSGLVVYHIEIPLAQGGHAQYWIEAKQWRVRQVDYEDELLGRGSVVVESVDCTTQGDLVPDIGAALDLPDGIAIVEVEVEEGQPLTLEEAQTLVSFTLLVPTYVPTGTNLASAYHVDRSIVLEYEGEQPFSLTQGRKVVALPQAQATPVSLGRGQAAVVEGDGQAEIALVWQEEAIQYSLLGALSLDEAIHVAESMDAVFKGAADE